jgi:hypothetical protein
MRPHPFRQRPKRRSTSRSVGTAAPAQVIHRSYPQAGQFHVKHDVERAHPLWIQRWKTCHPSELFHVKRPRGASSTVSTHSLWIVPHTDPRPAVECAGGGVRGRRWELVLSSWRRARVRGLGVRPSLVSRETCRLESAGVAWATGSLACLRCGLLAVAASAGLLGRCCWLRGRVGYGSCGRGRALASDERFDGLG